MLTPLLVAAQIWIAPAAQKIVPATPAPAGAPTAAQIAGAQNEFESFQVVVTGAKSGVSMSLDRLDDGAGHSISGRDITLYREALIQVPSPTGGDGAAGMWPDALVPDVDPIAGEKRNAFPFDVPEGESRAVFVDIHAPQSAPAGTYTGVLRVSGAQDVRVSFTVWDFAVPSTSTLRSAFGLAWNAPCVGHGDPNCSGGDADLALRARYVQAALDNRVSIATPYYSTTVDSSGNPDWTAFDRYAGPFLDGTAPTRLAGAKLTAVNVDGASIAPVTFAWAAHFAQKGWTPALFDYACDEPPLTCAWSDIGPRTAAAHAGSPPIPALVTTTVDQAAANGAAGIDLYAPSVNDMDGKPGHNHAGNQRANYPAVTWWYQSCMSFGCSGVGGGHDGNGETGWPTMAIDADATRNRAMEWLSFSYDISGELYYETGEAYFTGDPWSSQQAFGGAGDGTLFYPGTPAKIGGSTEIPVESLRLKQIRDGMEDYELLAMAAKLGLGAQAKAIAQGVYPKTYQATSTPAAIDAARAELAGLILHALGKDAQPPPPPAQVPTGSASAATGSAPSAQGGGCSSSSSGAAWLVAPLLAFFALCKRSDRRRPTSGHSQPF